MNKQNQVAIGIEAGIGCAVTIASDSDAPKTLESIRGKRRADELAGLIEEAIAGRTKLITKIAVGDESGSMTGLRIGIASALGLGSALRIPVKRLPLLRVLAGMDQESNRIVAIAGSASRIFFGEFERKTGALRVLRTENTSKVDETLKNLLAERSGAIVMTADVLSLIDQSSPGFNGLESSGEIIVCRTPLSELIALKALASDSN